MIFIPLDTVDRFIVEGPKSMTNKHRHSNTLCEWDNEQLSYFIDHLPQLDYLAKW